MIPKTTKAIIIKEYPRFTIIELPQDPQERRYTYYMQMQSEQNEIMRKWNIKKKAKPGSILPKRDNTLTKCKIIFWDYQNETNTVAVAVTTQDR